MTACPETKFVRSGDIDIAYQVVGDAGGGGLDGRLDLVVVPAWISNCELSWELPEFARFLQRFTEYSRLIVLDKRGTGLSDRVVSPPPWRTTSMTSRRCLTRSGRWPKRARCW